MQQKIHHPRSDGRRELVCGTTIVEDGEHEAAEGELRAGARKNCPAHRTHTEYKHTTAGEKPQPHLIDDTAPPARIHILAY
jgi:hypothetical protein